MEEIRNEGCSKCPMSDTCKNVCITGRGNQSADLMFVGEGPTYYDDNRNGVMIGNKFKLLKAVVEQVLEEEYDSFYRTHLVKCRNEEGYSKDYAENCFEYLAKEVAIVKPKVIVAIGNLVLEVLTGKKGITSNRGKIFETVIGGEKVKVIPVMSPGYVKENDKHLNNFAKDLSKAVNLSKGFDYVSSAVSNSILVDTREKVIELVDYIKATGVCCFDFETTGLNVHADDFEATVLAISFQHGSSYVIPLFHNESPFTTDEVEWIFEFLKVEVFQNYKIQKVAHNLKYDLHVAAKYGIEEMYGIMHDTMLMHHLLWEADPHGLKDLVSIFFKEFSGYETALGNKPDWANIPLEKIVPYAGTDTDLTLRLKTLLESYLLRDERLYLIYRNLTMAANKVLWQAEHEGMLIDKNRLLEFIGQAEEMLAEQEESMRNHGTVKMYERKTRKQAIKDKIDFVNEKIAGCKPLKNGGQSVREGKYRAMLSQLKLGNEGYSDYEPINFGSPAQLGNLLYGKNGFKYPMPYDRVSGEQKPKTGKEVIDDLPDPTGFIEQLKVWRSISKMLSTYLKGIYERLDYDNKIHTSFLLHGTESGRLSSRNPNLQNIPNIAKLQNEKAIKVVGMVKKVFIAPPGYTLMQWDYSQAELRIIADFADERTMIEAYSRGEDIHAKTGAKFAGVSLEELYKMDPKDVKRHRTNAKAGNFGLIYGMSPEGLVEYAKANYGLILTLAQAKKMHSAFFDLYPRLLAYHATYIGKARKYGHVRTLYGRTRKTPNINHSNEYIRSIDERVAVNSPIQGTAGEFTIFAIALLGLRVNPRVKLVNTVHDSIIFYIPHDIIGPTVDLIIETMENLPNQDYFEKDLKHLGMKVDGELSNDSWGDLKEYDHEKYLK